MRPGLSLLTVWNPSSLEIAGGAASDCASAIGGALGQIDASANWGRKNWNSTASDAAFSSIGEWQGNLSIIKEGLSSLATALSNGADAIAQPRIEALDLKGRAESEGFEVSDTGAVTVSAAQIAASVNGPLMSAALIMANLQALLERAAMLEDELRAALDNVDKADSRTSEAAQGAISTIKLANPSGGAMGASSPSASGSSTNPQYLPATPAQNILSTMTGIVTGGIKEGAKGPLKEGYDPVLGAVSGNTKMNPSPRMGNIGKFGSRLAPGMGTAFSLGMAQAGATSDIESGVDTSDAYISNYGGAAAGILAGVGTGALTGFFVGGPVGAVFGVVGGAAVSTGASELAKGGIRGILD